MRIKKSFVALLLVSIAAVGAAVLSQRGQQTRTEVGSLVFPGLLTNINDVNVVELASSDGVVTITHRDGWVVDERDGYPADGDKVRRLALAMAELRKVEPKTSKPELYGKLGLGGIDAEDSRSVLVTLRNDETALATLLVGDQKPGAPMGGAHQFYVRTLDDPQVWLVEGRLQTDGGRASAWMDSAVIDLDESRVRRVEVRHPDGETIVVERSAPEDKDLVLVGLQSDETIESSYGVNNIARTLVELELDDVQRAEDIDFGTDSTTATLETFDGLRISLTMVERDEKKYGRLEAEFDPALAVAEAGTRDDTEEGAKAKPGADADAQAARFNQLWAGRAYVLSADQYSGIAMRREDLVSRNEPEPKEKS